MIDSRPLRSAIDAEPGEVMGMRKHQLLTLLDEVDVGNQARRELTNLRSLTAIAASRVGAPA